MTAARHLCAWISLCLVFNFASRLNADDSPSNVRVMSFNIRYGTANDGTNHWDRRREFLKETIQKFNPDLLGTQETLKFQRDWLAEQLPGFGVLGVGRDDGRDAGEMMALYFREARFEKLDGGHFWLSESPEQPGSQSWDSSLPRMVTWVQLRDRQSPDARPLLFCNTHFDHQGREARRQSALLIRRRLEDQGRDCTLVLTGDFNDGEDGEPYRALFAPHQGRLAPVIDTFRARHPERSPNEGTFSSFLASETAGPRIDWIGVSRDLHVIDAGIDRTSRDGRTPSDHFPVTAVLERDLESTKTSQKVEAADSSPGLVAGGPCDVESFLNLAYYAGDDAHRHKHRLDLFVPRGIRDFPVLLFIHGGGWVSGDRKLYASVGKVFARNGVGTAVISYRLSPAVQHPAHIEDAARAFAWLKQNVERYGGRSDRLFVAGQSAGGHLTALLATSGCYLEEQGCSLTDIRGAIPISGIYEFPPGRFSRVLGDGAEAAASASPLRHISAQSPPFLILYAQNDIPGCDRMSGLFCRTLKQQNVEADVHQLGDRNHVSIMFRLMMSTRDPATQWMLKFIAAHSELKLHEISPEPDAGE